MFVANGKMVHDVLGNINTRIIATEEEKVQEERARLIAPSFLHFSTYFRMIKLRTG
jgi:hypothetical protein